MENKLFAYINIKRGISDLLIAVLFVVLFSSAASAVDKEELINMDFNNADIITVIKFISELTNKNFLVDDKVRGKVTIISPKEISVDEAYHVFESILEVYGYTVVPSGTVIKIIPLAEAKQRGVETIGIDGNMTGDDRVVTQLIPLKFVDSDAILPVIKPILSNTSFATTYSQANTLIITDLASNIRKLLAILNDLDVEGRVILPVIEIVPLKFAYSKTIASEIEKVFEAKKARKTGKARKGKNAIKIRVIPDERTNSLILVAMPVYIKEIKLILAELDVESQPGKMMEIKVISLDYASAKTIATELERVFEAKEISLPEKGGKHKTSIRKKPVRIIPDERTNSIIVISRPEYMKEVKRILAELDKEPPPGKGKINVYNLKNANAEELAKVLQTLTTNINRPSSSASRKKKPVELKDNVTITSNKATNALIIVASPQDYEVIKEVVEQLDVRRPQVFVEAMIMEVKTNDEKSFGIEWRTTSDFTEPGTQGFGGTNFGGINSGVQSLLNSSGLVLGVVDGTIKYKGTEFVNIGGLMRAIQQEGEVNILSTPNILTTDNEEAEIMVGENIPITVGSTIATGGQVTENIQRTDIGLILRIKPQINESDYVRLEIYQEISGISSTSAELKNPITTKRSAKTTVIVKDGQNIVIGGLIEEDTDEGISKVPLLGDIPILGWLFKYKNKKKRKTNLLIFISPHIIRNDIDIEKISEKKQKEIDLIYLSGKRKKKEEEGK